MFVDRDHWYGAPLHKDGTVSSGFETAKNFNTALSTLGYDEMDFKTEKLSAQFVFNNPNQTSACGCGESVQLTPAKDAAE